MKKVHDFIDFAHVSGSNFLDTELWKDIRWYHTILPVKTDRQLTNRWEIDNVDDDGCDHQYTGWVLEEVIEILEKAFYELLSSDSTSYEEKTFLHQILEELKSLEKEILSI